MNLTKNQTWVLHELKKQGCSWIEAATRNAWINGKTYYIDDRVKVRGIRRKFNQGNKEALRDASPCCDANLYFNHATGDHCCSVCTDRIKP
jgi:hypothetical protein